MDSVIPISQATRLGKFHSPLGPDEMGLLRFDGTEGVNQLGEYTVEAHSPQGGIDMDALLGLHGTVEIASHKHGPRFYDGIIAGAEVLDRRTDGWRYRLTLRPWFWLASLRRNQRIFHNKTVVQIITEVLGDYPFPNKTALMRSYEPVEYTVQYGESDLSFVCRMMERFGISYHFTHEKALHTMMLTDAPEAFKKAPGGKRIFQAVSDQRRTDEEHFSSWAPARKITTGRILLTDYNFKTPMAAMQADKSGGAVHAQGTIESFDYPGIYLNQGAGKQVARLEAERERVPDGLHHAAGDAISLEAGMVLTLAEHPDKALNGKSYLLVGARHSFEAEGYATGTTGGGGDSYQGQYVFHVADKPLAPAKTTPLGRISGPQTAVVVGEGEIDCDEYGRILVRFHWDLKGAHSMRCRVSQSWASQRWGGMVIPRIGMEVLVDFLEGDPDKPMVTGCVYNGKNMPAYVLPSHKTKMVIRSDTHQGEGFNEISFEDEAGRENIALHAQKDQTLKVLHNRLKRVDNDQVESVGQNKSIEVGNNHQEKIGGSMNLTVGGSGGALIVGLSALLGQAIGAMSEATAEASNPAVSSFAGALAAVSAMGEAASRPANGDFASAGGHKTEGGAEQMSTGETVGKTVGRVMPVSGILNKFVEKAESDTIGIARTEQIGVLKNTFVGAVQNTTVGFKQFNTIGNERHLRVGKKQFTTIGEEWHLNVGKKHFSTIGEEDHLRVGKFKTIDVGEEYTSHAGKVSAHSSGKLLRISSKEKFEGTAKVWEIKAEDKVLISAPGGYVEINKSGVRIRGKKVDIEGNSINLKRGGPGEGSKCLRAMVETATPFVR